MGGGESFPSMCEWVLSALSRLCARACVCVQDARLQLLPCASEGNGTAERDGGGVAYHASMTGAACPAAVPCSRAMSVL
eukprot:COSAG02_NODE_233_length_27847_cov_20.383055_7_plen_79_part_00